MIFNRPYVREAYFAKIQEINLGSYKSIQELYPKARQFHSVYPRRYMHGRQNTNVSGDYITHSHNVRDSFFIDEFENCRYCFLMGLQSTKDCHDFCWGGGAELTYEAAGVGIPISNSKFVYECWPNCFDLAYSMMASFSSPNSCPLPITRRSRRNIFL